MSGRIKTYSTGIETLQVHRSFLHYTYHLLHTCTHIHIHNHIHAYTQSHTHIITYTHTHIITYTYIHTRTHTHTYTAPSAPRNFRITSNTSTSITLAWDTPDPLNGVLGLYLLQYAVEGTADNLFSSIFIFSGQQATLNSLQATTIYLLKLRASTIGTNGQSLFGPDALMRVQNGQR